ncbi:hypothetical protein O3M35_011040 [Rhynocoris fuscipes]|uniref:Uncharacterized protein n=1 Tax=Rhynocoris fuscipes TaxID=488301 RepID=A0AAW1CV46_9HEMI
MRSFPTIPNSTKYRVVFSLDSELCPTKSSKLTYFLLIKIYIYFFFFFNLTYDMMTRQKFYI